jgi:hypothetical protein
MTLIALNGRVGMDGAERDHIIRVITGLFLHLSAGCVEHRQVFGIDHAARNL